MTQLHAGDVVGNRFEIDRAAGSGGMATVYRARDRYSGDSVALKLIHGSMRGVDDGERFVREAQLLAELRHPGIVSYVAHGQTSDGQRFLAMEWLEGEDLGHRLKRHPLSLGQCLTLLAHVAEALEVAHQRGVIHRDLKPTNLFLVAGEVERVKLLDFGIARRQAASRAMTRTGMVVGTPEYMAPEQARGSRELTPATDMFSLGCMLYECLSGDPPFVAEHIAAVLVRILFEEPVPIASRCPGIPDAIGMLLDDLLQKDASSRVPDAAALRKRLAQLGELPELPLLPTVAVATQPPSVFAESEQVLFSLVVAAGPQQDVPQQDIPLASTLPVSRTRPDMAPRIALLSAVRALGARAEYLIDGTLVATMPQTGSAQDQATMAARVALLIKERWPEATVAVTTGRGRAQGSTAVGEVADRAVQILERRTGEQQATAVSSISGVWLDELSLRLLGPRFAVTKVAEGTLLIGEEREGDESRPLLGKPTPCVGREAEFGILEAELGSCIDESEARLILITAPPGGGKSRLRHEFLRRVEARPESVTVLFGRGDIVGAGTPYGIIATAIRRLCGLSGSEQLAEQQEGLRKRIARHVAPAAQDRVVFFIGELCGIPFSGEGQPMLQSARHDPKIMRDAVWSAFIDWLRSECTASPILLVVDDLQWGDALTVGLIDEALQKLHRTALCVLALARPEVHETFPKLWQGQQLQQIPLKPLSRKACARLIVQVLGKEVAPETVERAIEQSAGNALFLEELIRSISEGKHDERSETIIAMLQARIGRLDAGPRRAIRAAAVFGQTFWRGGVARLLGFPRSSPELESWLSALADAEMIYRHSNSRLLNESEYGFRHALVRDAAYSLLTDNDVLAGHRLAGEFLEAVGDQDSISIAEHFERGGAPQQAVKHFISAADWAASNHVQESVLKLAERGIACDATGESLGVLQSLRCAAHAWQDAMAPACVCGVEALSLLPRGGLRWCKLMNPLFLATSSAQQQVFGELVGQFAIVQPHAEAQVAYVEAAAWLVLMLSGVGQRGPAQNFLALLDQVSRSLSKSEAAAWGQVRLAQETYALMLEPDPWLGLSLCQDGADFAEQAQDWRHLVVLWCHQGMAQHELGDIQGAERTLRGAVKLAERIREPMVVGHAAGYLSWHLSLRPESELIDEAVRIARSALAVQQVNPFIAGVLHYALAGALMRQGDSAAAAIAARASCEILVVSLPLRIRAYSIYMQALLQQGCTTEAQAVGEKGMQELTAGGGTGFSEVGFLITLAEARYAVGDPSAARSALGEALHRMNLRAEKIPSSAVREQYLTQTPESVRIRELAHRWLPSEAIL